MLQSKSSLYSVPANNANFSIVEVFQQIQSKGLFLREAKTHPCYQSSKVGQLLLNFFLEINVDRCDESSLSLFPSLSII